MTTNEQLQRDVLDELAWEPSVDASGIGVTARDGVVTLTGHVKTYSEKWAAAKAAKRVAGVLGLADEIEVRLPGSSLRDDADIAHAALEALRWRVSVPEDRIRVTVKDGWMTLEGDVDWRYQRDLAESVIRHLAGVKGVNCLIRVKSMARPQEVRTRIESALKRSAEVEAQQIRIETHDGVVTLRGNVHSWSEREAAERAAWAAPGVTSVDNLLVIQSRVFA